jgi:hypothetical protein
MTNDEIEDYDLSTTGIVVELTETSTHERYRAVVRANVAVDFVVEIRGGTVGYTQIDSFPGTDSFDAGFERPETVDIRVRNTTTGSGTADAILGSGGR